jgi:hypothetical protein
VEVDREPGFPSAAIESIVGLRRGSGLSAAPFSHSGKGAPPSDSRQHFAGKPTLQAAYFIESAVASRGLGGRTLEAEERELEGPTQNYI